MPIDWSYENIKRRLGRFTISRMEWLELPDEIIKLMQKD